MRSTKKNKMKHVMPALAAAGLASMVSGAAYGSFLVSFTNGTSPAFMSGGFDVYILQEVNQNTAGPQTTGTSMGPVDITVSTPGSTSANAFLIQTAVDIDADGLLADYNVTGQPDQQNASLGTTNQAVPSFGSAIGTFIGYNTSSTVLKTATVGLAPTANGILQSVYVNDQTYANHTALVTSGGVTSSTSISGTPAVYETNEDGSGNPNIIDPAFISGTVHSLEVQYNTNINSDTVAHKIANLVVPHGTPISAIVQIGSLLSGTVSEVYTVSAGNIVVVTTPTISLTATPTHASNTFGPVNLVGGEPAGFAPQTIQVPVADAVTGSLVVNGFTTGNTEIYALEAQVGGVDATGTALATIITELSGGAMGVTVTAVTDPRIKAMFPLANVEATGLDPSALNYDLTGDPNGATLASIGVVPEPTGVGVLVLGGLGLLGRRRRSVKA